jgi:hypothetical protein
MDPALTFVAFWVYTAAVLAMKHRLYPWAAAPGPLPRERWRKGYESMIFFSPDYWWAWRMKMRLKAGAPERVRARLLRHYVIRNNRMNVRFSLFLAAVCVVLKELSPDSLLFHAAGTVAVIRFVSRGVEIAYAFGRDVLQTRASSTNLRTGQRVRLTLFSYLEIFLYSMAAYTMLPTVLSAREALILALNVGTLTNVGYAYPDSETPLVVTLVFGQVIATLSLVVLSLAAYLSRTK